MKRYLVIIALTVGILAMSFASCSKKSADPTPTHSSHWYSPEPGANGTLPTEILPEVLQDSVLQYFQVYNGENPPAINGQFVSSPHVLIYTTVPDDTIPVFNDRYIAFQGNSERIDFYGKQWDDSLKNQNGTYGAYYYETYRQLHVVGTGDNFTCYYLTEGYPNGLYAKQSTVFSGRWNDTLGGLGNFQVAVILLETSGNTHLAPAGSYRVLGDGVGLAENNNWMGGKREVSNDMIVTDEDPFRMFRKK